MERVSDVRNERKLTLLSELNLYFLSRQRPTADKIIYSCLIFQPPFAYALVQNQWNVYLNRSRFRAVSSETFLRVYAIPLIYMPRIQSATYTHSSTSLEFCLFIYLFVYLCVTSCAQDDVILMRKIPIATLQT